MPVNFMRHYYDVFCLLDDESVQAFIGTQAYLDHKDHRFRGDDERELTRNEAFALSDPATRRLYAAAYDRTRALYYRRQPSLDEILARLGEALPRL